MAFKKLMGALGKRAHLNNGLFYTSRGTIRVLRVALHVAGHISWTFPIFTCVMAWKYGTTLTKIPFFL